MVLTLLRSIYDPRLPMPPEEIHWQDCLEQILEFSVSSQVISVMKQYGRWEQTPAFVRERLTADADVRLPQNWFLKRKEEDALRLLDGKRIAAIPLKGTRFSEKYYGHFAGRLSGDLDLLIRPQDLDRAIETLMENGYRFKKIIHNHAVLEGAGGRPLVELHWTLDKTGWSDVQAEPFWQQASPIAPYRHMLELSATDDFYFMCLHAVRHRVDSLRYILDIAQMLHHAGPQIDYAALAARAAADKTRARIRTVLSIVYEALPHLHGLKPLPFRMRRTAWTYPAIRDARRQIASFRCYRYRLYFKLLIFDTWKHRWQAQRKPRPRAASGAPS